MIHRKILDFLSWFKKLMGVKVMPNLKKPEIVDIEVIVTRDPPDSCNIDFAFPEKKNGKVKHWKDSKDNMYHVSFENQGADGFIVLFNIEDDCGTGCRFHSNPVEAMWSHGQPSCPRVQGNWPQFMPIGVINDRRTLIVYNKNSPAHQFGFTLRFDTTDCGDQEFDPIGDNMNGF